MQRIRAVARTLADLADGSTLVSGERLALALALRAPVMTARVAA
jgi:predicted ATPase with chaperone activity